MQAVAKAKANGHPSKSGKPNSLKPSLGVLPLSQSKISTSQDLPKKFVTKLVSKASNSVGSIGYKTYEGHSS